ncbi:DUF4189 domain-containing protein [Xanthomonas arboricola]|uniref:DUF4189 domain-containing protein n=1 Tax=Xanthomonas arboricola TaxID=56448 RepID=UPI002157E8DB|nr:DUF4189 domain-containing protein [Xanthomonas arboricola]
MAGSDSTGEVGTTVGKFSESDARQAAISQCALGGAGDCKVDLVYRNQCAAFAISQSATFFQASATEERAVSLVKKKCEDSKGGLCKVRYSECSNPIFKKY